MLRSCEMFVLLLLVVSGSLVVSSSAQEVDVAEYDPEKACNETYALWQRLNEFEDMLRVTEVMELQIIASYKVLIASTNNESDTNLAWFSVEALLTVTRFHERLVKPVTAAVLRKIEECNAIEGDQYNSESESAEDEGDEDESDEEGSEGNDVEGFGSNEDGSAGDTTS